MKESEIQNVICEYLALKRHFFWRQNTVPIFSKGNYRAMPKFSLKGVPDIIIIRGGQFVGLEVKRPGGKLSEFQEEFRNNCLKNGGDYHVVESLDDVLSLGF